MRNKLHIGAILFFCGSAMGSFLNCICDRMIRKESILGRSRCTECSCVLEAIDLIPVFSYLFLKGRCRRCGKKIDPFCFFSEILGGLMYVLICRRFDCCRELAIYLISGSTMLLIAFYDSKSMLIPDWAMIFLLLIRIAHCFLMKEDPVVFLIRLSGSFLLSLFLSAFIFYGERITGKEMMGYGDVVLILILGSFMDLQENLLTMFLSSLFAMIYGIPMIKKKQFHCIPFAPAICLAYLIMFLYDRQIMHFYLSLFQK